MRILHASPRCHLARAAQEQKPSAAVPGRRFLGGDLVEGVPDGSQEPAAPWQVLVFAPKRRLIALRHVDTMPGAVCGPQLEVTVPAEARNSRYMLAKLPPRQAGPVSPDRSRGLVHLSIT